MAIIVGEQLERTLNELGTYLRFELQSSRLATDCTPYHLCIRSSQNSSRGARNLSTTFCSMFTSLMLPFSRKPAHHRAPAQAWGEWAELFKLADKTICMPISEGVSGSYNAAATARDMVLAEEPNRQIHLVNSRAAGGRWI